MKIVSGVVAVGLLSCSLCFQAHGTLGPINGDLAFGNGLVMFDTNSLMTAKKVMTWNAPDPNTGNPTVDRVTVATGSFAGFQVHTPGVNGDVVTASPWTFNPSTMTNPLWQVDGFTFALTSSTIDTQNTSFLDVEGVGTITGNNFDPTPGLWSFISTSSGGATNTEFSFSADTFAAIPEPSTWVVAALAAFVAVYSQRRRLSHAVKRSAG